MGIFDFFKQPGKFQVGKTNTADGVSISQFHAPPIPTPGNVAVCLSGGGSRAMTAGVGNLRGLNFLQLNGQSLLRQSRALSTVSGGSWVGQTFSYLKNTSIDDFLNAYVVDPGRLVPTKTAGHSVAETLDELPDGAITATIDSELFSPVPLAILAYLHWKFLRVPSNMLWQTLIGSFILKPYDLFDPGGKQSPTSLFSYNDAVLKRDVNTPNPSLADETAHLLTTCDGQVCRPFPLCNMAMFVTEKDDDFAYLAPVQSTPFVTGIYGKPGGLDANSLAPGGGGVTSFGFNSQPVSGDATGGQIEQARQWSLTDSIGTSSAFFAEILTNFFADWEQDSSLFRDALEKHIDKIVDHFKSLAEKSDSKLLDVLIDLLEKLVAEFGDKHDDLAQRIDGVFGKFKLGADILSGDMRDLGLDGIVPKYGYWPISRTTPIDDFKDNRFADGGDLENTGLAGAFAYDDVDNAISFVNTSTRLSRGRAGVFRADGSEIPDSNIIVDGQIPVLFGYQPYDDGKGYRLYADDANPKQPIMRHNQIFPSDRFAELLQALWTNSGSGDNTHPAVCKQQLILRQNDWFGVKGGKTVNVLWFYNNRVKDWYDVLSQDVKDILGDFDDPGSFFNFPNYSLLKTNLNKTESNLLAQLSAWIVANDTTAALVKSMYQ